MSIETNLSPDGTFVTLVIPTRFDISLYKTFGESYQPYIGKVLHFNIDLSQTNYIDSSALGMLLMLRERAGGEKATIVLQQANSTIREAFKITHMGTLFRIE
ncbi:MAG: STAS domain-containing protein [Desulfobacterales bacterium]|nr:STAS domain-containing protein [Desulfobacterales bacterium]